MPPNPPPLSAVELEQLLGHGQLFGATSNISGGGPGATQRWPKRHDPRVLVVDDDDHIRRLTSCALEMEGYEVVTAAHGAAALEQITRRSPNVILLDLMMLVVDGWQFSRAYHRLPGPHAPIIVLTAAADAGTYAADVNAECYLSKPFNLDDLLTSVDRLAHTSAN